jgi:hypothetical protein
MALHRTESPVPADDEHDDHFTELVERRKTIPTSREPVPF